MDHVTDRQNPLPVPRELQVRDPDSGRVRPAPPELLKGDPAAARLAAEQRSRPVHPAQLYSTITAWLLAGLLVAYFTLPHLPGRVFALMLMLEGGTRSLLELLRTEPAVAGSMSLSMMIGIGLVIAGIVMWITCGRFQRDWPVPAPGAAQPVPATA
jgi:prolipoprotein diacylglyceryltransferase